MILVDTSVWISIIRGQIAVTADEYEEFHVCGPVVQEFLQGMTESSLVPRYADIFLNIPVLSDPVPLRLFVNAADIFRQGRRRGLRIRSGMDCLIAAIALENDAVIWHRDRDYDNIAKFTNLKVRRSLYAN